ncbi:hypothetical protein KUM39_15760 [Streptomyces sp. J2-1]|uniref:hypothetical protein n=1 Tax=Streptomyces corallincola TaxID=2851888 RepID=UPI001C38605E|nr:hypothetical protein [Streptomyces corallincola]MBV2355813.1 hypothetical protein [Streptomyces corallincola]
MANARGRMRSTTVVLGGMGLLATALTACSNAPDKRCVDRDSYRTDKGYKIVSDRNCGSGGANGVWYYKGSKKGSWVNGGSFTAPRKGSGGSSGGHSGVHRGGFGGGHGSSGG